MKQKNFLFLDFDGVICDSLAECYASSWLAFYRFYRNREASFIPIDAFKTFSSLRPFIRSGEDYILILELQEKGIIPENQHEFDGYIEKAGPEKMNSFKEIFYKGRNFIIREDQPWWLSLNKLYPPMKDYLKEYVSNDGLYILSTKKAAYILDILKDNGITFPPQRVLYAGDRLKYDFIEDILKNSPSAKAYFVDDQIDHFKHKQNPQIIPCLADWGYIKQEWLKEPFQQVTLKNIKELFGFI